MKNLYLSLILTLTVMGLTAQNPNNSHALAGTCLNPDEGTISFVFDLSQNCPEQDPNNELAGIAEMGLHSGINEWSTIVDWASDGAATLTNNGNDSFLLTLNVMDYWGAPFGDVESIRVIPNKGALTPDDAWSNSMRDTTDGGGFGGDEPCSDMIIHMNQTPTCADLAQNSSLVLFSDAGDSQSCVDEADGLVRVEMDYALACPEGDEDNLLAGQNALAFHSGINSWATVVAWDDANAMQLQNDGNDNFSAVIDVQAYYGTPLGDITEINMAANNGLANPNAPWDNTIRDPRDGGFGGSEPCSDLIMILSEAPACDLSLGVNDLALQQSLKVSPNPFRNRAFLEFDNPQNETFSLVITDMTGQVVRTMQRISGERVLVEREDLPSGMYFANLRDQDGNFATTKLVVK